MRFRKKPVVNDVPAAVPFQARVGPWLLDCFGIDVADDIRERGDRLLEEVLELLQSHGYDPARVATLRDYVFSRPVGDPVQEVGGVMVTLAAYCCAARIDMHGAGETELARILQPEVTEKIRRKQASKRGLHTPLPTAPEAAPAGEVVGYVYPDDVAELAANRAKGKTWFTHLWSKPTGQAGCPVFAAPQPAPAAQGDPGEFGVGIQPNPKARYWQERADFWRGQAIALGYTPDEGATAQQPAPAAQGGRATVVDTHCGCHPETCCCGDYTLLIDGRGAANGGKQNMQAIADAINATAQQPVAFRNMGDDATFEDYRDQLAIGGLAAVDQMAFDNMLHERLEAQPVAVDGASIEQRARELLAAEYENGHLFDTAHRIRSHEPPPAGWQDDCIAIRAITAALRSGSQGDQG